MREKEENNNRSSMMAMQDIEIDVEGARLFGDLVVPSGCRGLVIFAHGSGSGRKSPRNQEVARVLQRYGFATLLFDLLTVEEERKDLLTREYRFNILLLAKRLELVTLWVPSRADLGDMKLGYFGASTGAAAALIAAAKLPGAVQAVVSRGGRPDLADPFLGEVTAATLLIVGSEDREVIHLNQEAQAALVHAETKLELVEGAGHLFEGEGQLEKVSELAGKWFETFLDAKTKGSGASKTGEKKPPESHQAVY